MLRALNKGDNQKNTPMRHMKEVVQLFSEIIWSIIVCEIRESPYYVQCTD